MGVLVMDENERGLRFASGDLKKNQKSWRGFFV